MGLADILWTIYYFIQTATAAGIFKLQVASITDRVNSWIIFPVVVFAAPETIIQGIWMGPWAVPNI